MTFKTLTYFMFSSLSLFSISTSHLSLEASSREELCEINHTNIKRIIEKQLQDNPGLLTSSLEKDIVVFLGKTGAGKSTLINYLTDKELKIDDDGFSVNLRDTMDVQAMKISSSATSETLLPKFISYNNLILYDLPGFDDTRGTAISLINAYFIKTLIENAKSTRLIFVTGQGEYTEGRAESVKRIINITKTLIPNEMIESCSSLVVTKAHSFNNDKQIFVNFLRRKTLTNETEINSSFLTLWIDNQRITKMSLPSNNIINPDDKWDILRTILNTTPKKLSHINISAIYNGEEKNKLKEIYQAEIKDISNNLYDSNFSTQDISVLDRISLENKKNYFQDSFLNNIITTLNQSPLITLLKPLSQDIYDLIWNEMEEILALKIKETIKTIDIEIKEQDLREEEQRRIQAEQNLRESEQRLIEAQQAEQAAEQQYIQAEQNLRESEQRRIQAEQAGQAAEQQRIQAEQNLRGSEQRLIEAQQSAEQQRIQAEQNLRESEQRLIEAEQAGQAAEQQRIQVQEQRLIKAEIALSLARYEAEQQRQVIAAQVQAEQARQAQRAAEDDKKLAEQKCIKAQNAQAQAEQIRQAEMQRRIRAEAKASRLEEAQQKQKASTFDSNYFRSRFGITTPKPKPSWFDKLVLNNPRK